MALPVLPRGRASRAVLLLLVLAAAVLGLPALAPAAVAADPLISQGKPVTASSTENAAFPATAAVDGNPGTRWSSAAADPQWIQVDLGATATVTQVVLQWETAFGRAFQIQTAAAAAGPFTTIFSTTTGTGGTQTLAVTGTGRYVRMNGTARATQFGYSLWEFQVFGTFGGTPPPAGCDPANAALNRPATTSSTENAGTPASAAVDGNGTTRWSSASGDFAGAFHTYGMDWDASHMTFSVDGTAFFTLTKAQVEATRGPWVYDHPFFVILDNAVGGDFPGNPDATTVLPQRMLVDYVRVFQ